MTDLFTHRGDADRVAALAIADALPHGPLDRKTLNAAMIEARGGTDAAGCWTQRDSFELMEAGLVIHLQKQGTPIILDDVVQRIALVDSLPTQTVRSEEQIALQQFSTPADLAALAVVLAQPRATDIVLEPSAGNGLLVAQLPRVQALYLNELDEPRRGRLRMLFPGAHVSSHDGALINATMADLPRPTLILMNPPFSRDAGRGEDQHAAARHLQAALRRLAPGGRLVAIMPDWFARSASMTQVYEATLSGTSVQTAIRLEQCYRKHGTGIAVRLYVIDKKPGHIAPVLVQRRTVAEILSAIAPIPRVEVLRTAPQPAVQRPARRGTSLFRSMRSASRPAPRIARAPAKNDILPVAYEVLADARALGDPVGVYLPYRPSRIDFAAAGAHPTPLVESVAMGSIAGPKPGYVPHLPERTVTERLLSEPQLETLVYAGHAWSQYLPGRFVPDKEGVGLTLSDQGYAYRKGYFLGDGTGAGKGRQIASAILDNWLQGRRRAIWISKNEQLLEDARRDWTALGGLSADIQPLSRWKIDEPIAMPEGVLFVTYPTLRSQRQDVSRLKQIIDWAGDLYEGVLAFDEAHEMGGVAGGEGALGRKNGSQQGVAGVLLQNNLPDARVLYASATGASDVNNLAYAVRLGLWGPETAFANREQFISEIRIGGIAAMELVAVRRGGAIERSDDMSSG